MKANVIEVEFKTNPEISSLQWILEGYDHRTDEVSGKLPTADEICRDPFAQMNEMK